MNPHAYLFVDGSSSRKQDLGAWAAIAATDSARKLLFGTEYPTTISRCELLPIIAGLRWINAQWQRGTGFRVAVFSDSEYTVKTLCGIYSRRKNKDLWVGLDEAASGMEVTYRWRERNTLFYMEVCDAICGGLRKATIGISNKQFKDYRKPEQVLPYDNLPDVSGDYSRGL